MGQENDDLAIGDVEGLPFDAEMLERLVRISLRGRLLPADRRAFKKYILQRNPPRARVARPAVTPKGQCPGCRSPLPKPRPQRCPMCRLWLTEERQEKKKRVRKASKPGK